MNIISMLHWKIEDIFLRSFMDEDFRVAVGFEKISTSMRDLPSWFLWVNDRKGAYELEIIQGRTISQRTKKGKEAHYWGRTVLRYFPHPDEEVFNKFSIFEQVLRLGDAFDHTGTPKYAEVEKLHPSHFFIGSIEFFFASSGKVWRIILETQDRWIEYRMKGLKLSKDGVQLEVLAPGEKDRNLPGWELCWPFFSKLVKAFCHVYQIHPSLVYIANAPGKIIYYEEGEKETLDYTWDYPTRRLEVAFVFAEDPAERTFLLRMLKERIRSKANAIKRGEIFKIAKGEPLPTLQKLYDVEKGGFVSRAVNYMDKNWWVR